MDATDGLNICGQVLDGQYRVDAVVGEGALSVVYRGHHLGLDAPVAIKCLNLPVTLDDALTQAFVDSFIHATRVHYRLSQGNLHIVRTLASGTTKSPATGTVVPYLVREWLEGTSLAKDFASRRVEGHAGRSLPEAFSLLDTAADALAFAHEHGDVHHHVNPGNLFVVQTPSRSFVKVFDFGVAKVVHAHSSRVDAGDGERTTGLRLFFPAYAAPEQLDTKIGAVGPAADVYAFALVFLEALRDAPVLPVKGTVECVQRTLDPVSRPTPRSLGLVVPEPVEQVLTKAVALKPTDRYPSMGVFWSELRIAIARHTSQKFAAVTVKQLVAGSAPPSMPPAPAARVSLAPRGAGGTKPPPGPPPSMRPPSMRPPTQVAAAAPAPAFAATLPPPFGSPAGEPVVPNAARAPSFPGPTVVMSPPALIVPGPQKAAPQLGGATAAAVATMPEPERAPEPEIANVRDSAVVPVAAPPAVLAPPPVMAPAVVAPPPVAAPAAVPEPLPPRPVSAPAPVLVSVARVEPMPLRQDSAADLAGVPRPLRRAPLLVAAMLGAVFALGATLLVIQRLPASEATASAAEPAAAPPVTNVAAPAVPVAAAPAVSAPAPNAVGAPAHAGARHAEAPAADVGPRLREAPASAPAATEPVHAESASPLTSPTSRSTRERGDGDKSTRRAPEPEPAVTGKNFSPSAARKSLSIIDGILASCKRPGGVTGQGEIRIVFDPSGSVKEAQVQTPRYVGTKEGACVESRFRTAKIPPFEGAPGPMLYTFTIRP